MRSRVEDQSQRHGQEYPPQTLFLGDEIEECLMDAGIRAELWMESCGHYFSLADCYGIAALGGEHFDSGTDAFDLGGANEDHLQRLVA